jgi:Flp pilus assembly protein TadG
MKKPNAPISCEQRNTRLLRRSTERTDAGQAIVEMALVIPFLVLLLIGALEFGTVAFSAIEVSNAAEAGALFGSQNRANAANTAGITLAAQNDASSVPGLTATPTTSCACQSAAGTLTALSCAATTTCTTPSQVVEWVTVITGATVNPPVYYPGIVPRNITLKGQATMRVAQQ